VRWWFRGGRWLRTALLGTFFFVWSFYGASTDTSGAEGSEAIPPEYLLWVWAGTGLAALALSRLLPKRATEAHRIEHAKRLKERGTHLMAEGAPVNAALTRDLAAHLEQLQHVKDDTEREREITALIAKHNPMITSIVDRVEEQRGRKAQRQQWKFLAISFLLGFIVNWLSEPLLKGISSLLH
jgi:hypothetical protein